MYDTWQVWLWHVFRFRLGHTQWPAPISSPASWQRRSTPKPATRSRCGPTASATQKRATALKSRRLLNAILLSLSCHVAFGWFIISRNKSLFDSLNEFHNTFLTRFVTNPTFGNQGNGAFLDSCLGHCEAQPYDLDAMTPPPVFVDIYAYRFTTCKELFYSPNELKSCIRLQWLVFNDDLRRRCHHGLRKLVSSLSHARLKQIQFWCLQVLRRVAQRQVHWLRAEREQPRCMQPVVRSGHQALVRWPFFLCTLSSDRQVWALALKFPKKWSLVALSLCVAVAVDIGIEWHCMLFFMVGMKCSSCSRIEFPFWSKRLRKLLYFFQFHHHHHHHKSAKGIISHSEMSIVCSMK